MGNTPQTEQNDQWDSWLDAYITEKMPELTVNAPEGTSDRKTDHSGGWYTGKRKNGAKRRKVVLPEEEAPEEEEAPRPAPKKAPSPQKKHAAPPEKREERDTQSSSARKPVKKPAQKSVQEANRQAHPPKNPSAPKKTVQKRPEEKPAPRQEPPLEYRTITIPIHQEAEASPAPAAPRKRKPMRGFYEPAQAPESPEEERVRNMTGSQFRNVITTVGLLCVGLSVIGLLWAAAKQAYLAALLLLVVGALAGGMLYLTNLYFTKSVIEPIRAITETTRRIADGSYGVQIEKSYKDEIGELAESINDMSKKISEAERMKSEFISSVSHELRTPLTAINGWGETLLAGQMPDQRDEQKGLAIICSEAKRLTKMVEELLEFSRMEDGRFVLRMELVDIKAELEDSVYTYREFFRKKGIELEYHDCEEEFPPIPGDPERLKQVFTNLMDNAAKHGGSGRRIIVSIFPDNAYVAIRVRDYGPGIPPEELPLVKTKFYKGSSKARGSGIGLAVCDEIAIRHNGSLEIANANGGGCVVTLRLPLHAES